MAFKTFDELATYAALEIHNALLEGGGKSMKASVHMWLGQAVHWHNQQKEPTPNPLVPKPKRKRRKPQHDIPWR